MSALRLASPGQPLRIIDLGPSVARRSHGSHDARPVTVIGEMVPRLLPPSTSPARQAQMAAWKAARLKGPACGILVRSSGRPCGRSGGHDGGHR